MRYHRVIRLKDGRECVLRNGTAQDGAAVLAVFLRTHEQTDFMLTYPDEVRFTAEEEGAWLKEKTESDNAVEILAVVDGEVVGTAGIAPVGNRRKIRHRAELGVGIDRAFWGLGIGRALTKACIECAAEAGYSQLELEVVEDNAPALSLYRSEGFAEYGRNPRGFITRDGKAQPLLLMYQTLAVK